MKKVTRKATILVGLVLLFVLAMGISTALARNAYVAWWQAHYPGSTTDDDIFAVDGKYCRLCHGTSGGGSPWNQYGWALRGVIPVNATQAQLDTGLDAVDGLNSDNDITGSSNTDEINAGTQPGWTTGLNTVYDKTGATSLLLPPGVPDLDPSGTTTTTTTVPPTTTTTIPGPTTTTTIGPTTTTVPPAPGQGWAWWEERSTNRGQGPGEPPLRTDLYWKSQTNNTGKTSPHGGFTDSTNLCKTCHAVHGARSDSYRLLRNSSRETECWFCHEGTSPASEIWVYMLEETGATVLGEHSVADLKPLSSPYPAVANPYTGANETTPAGYKFTPASTWIPDSNVNGGTISGDDYTGYMGQGNYPNLSVGLPTRMICGTCHSVHGAEIVADSGLKPKILRIDPAGDGHGTPASPEPLPKGIPAGDAPGTAKWSDADGAGSGDTAYNGVIGFNGTDYTSGLTLFCADCHNLNMNWTDSTDARLNKKAHPMNVDHNMEVYHEPTQVSSVDFPIDDCKGCHDELPEYGAISPYNPLGFVRYAAFPHQSKGHKLFGSDYNTPGAQKTGPGDSYRILPSLDQVCLKCHVFGAEDGVGKSF